MNRELGKIDRAFFGIEDHGILSFGLTFDFGGVHQGTGNYNLQNGDGWKLVKAVLRMFGESEVPALTGKIVYALRADGNPFGPIVGLERLPFDGGEKVIFQEVLDADGY